MKIRCVYNDGNFLEFTQHEASKYLEIDRSKLESVVLFDDSDHDICTITIPQGYTFAYRTRSMIGINSGHLQERFIILGIVNKNDQILHFVTPDGKVELIDTPEEFARFGKINPLRPEEAI